MSKANTASYTLSFSEINRQEGTSLALVGGKGANLGELTRAGFDVPPGFVLATRAYEKFIQDRHLTKQIETILQEAKDCATEKQNSDKVNSHLASAEAASDRIRALFMQQEMPKDVETTLLAAYHKLITENNDDLTNNDAVAVRSSATTEDSQDASFAGQHETYLNIQSKQALLDAVKQCWASLWTARAIAYRQQHQIEASKQVTMAVVIQQQINSIVSGVAFSLNPANNCFDEAVINSNFGLGETIVSGTVTPDSFVVNKVSNEILERKIASKDHILVSKPGGGLQEQSLEDSKLSSLTDEQVRRVTQLVSEVEDHYGISMDIEWAMTEEEGATRLHLLQARPITVHNPLFPEMITRPGESKNLYVDLLVLTQGFLEPMSELGLDIWSRMVVVTFGVLPGGMDGFFFNKGGRQYFHISNMLSWVKASIDFFENYDMEMREVFKYLDLEKEYKSPVKSGKVKWASWHYLPCLLRRLPIMIAGRWNPERATVKCQKALESAYKFYKNDISKEGRAFAEMVDLGIAQRFRKIIFAIIGVGNALQPGDSGLYKMFQDQNVDDLIGCLSAASPTNPTAHMGDAMLRLASFEELAQTATEDEFVDRLKNGGYSQAFMETYNNYMERYGARGFKEIDIAAPRTYETPRSFFNQLKSLNVEHNSRDILKERKEEAYQKLLTLAKGMGKQKQFVQMAQMYMTQLGLREAPKYVFVVMVDELRKKALQLGEQFVSERRLDSAEQIFDLNVDQVSEAETNTNLDLQALREENLAPRKLVAHVKDWPKIMDSRGKIFRYVRPCEEGDLAGEAISSGVVRGRAKVLTSPYEKPLKRGEILVTRATEPAWTPVFINAAGVVLEIGGPLQHGAIIAREYNLPCVSGIPHVCDLLKDGDLIEVDGTSGTVRLANETN